MSSASRRTRSGTLTLHAGPGRGPAMLLGHQPGETTVLSFDELYTDLVAIGDPLPANLERQLGYFETARFVVFHYEPIAEGVLWSDGTHSGFGCGSWRSYADSVEPIAARYGVRLGCQRDRGMVLLIDRKSHRAYFAPWKTANEIVATMQSDIDRPVTAGDAPVASGQAA